MKRLLELKDFGTGIEPEHEQELCNILGTHDANGFLNCIIGKQKSYSVNAFKAILAWEYLSQFYYLPHQIKKITDSAKIPCLIGRRRFEEDVQQFTCKAFNDDNCTCHKEYLSALVKTDKEVGNG